ncbi:MAG: glycosyltransferase family 4 protein [archaeon]
MKLLVFPNDALEALDEVGYEDHNRYFNPGRVFSEVYMIYHYNRTICEKRDGMIVLKQTGPVIIRELLMTLKGIRLIMKHDIDVIRAYNPYRAGVLAVICKLVTGKPVVVSLHNNYDKLWLCRKFGFLVRGILAFNQWLSLRFSTEAWCMTPFLKKYALERGAKRAVVTPNKVDLERYKDLPSREEIRKKLGWKDFVFLYVGRFANQKNVLRLLEAFSRVPNAKLVMVGDGELKHKLESQVQKYGISERVDFPGFIKNTRVAEYMIGADCFVLPSLTEGFGIVLIEAQAAGLPIIASDIPETKYIVNNNYAMLFDPKSSEDLNNQMIKISRNKSIRHRLMRVSLKSSKHFDWKHLESREANLYKKLLSTCQ